MVALKPCRAASWSASPAWMVGLWRKVIASDESFDAGKSAQASRNPQIVRLNSDRAAEHGARLVEVLHELSAHCDGGFDALADLLEIAFAGAATLEARFDVARIRRCAAMFSFASVTK